jgi:hypothetical protein
MIYIMSHLLFVLPFDVNGGHLQLHVDLIEDHLGVFIQLLVALPVQRPHPRAPDLITIHTYTLRQMAHVWIWPAGMQRILWNCIACVRTRVVYTS